MRRSTKTANVTSDQSPQADPRPPNERVVSNVDGRALQGRAEFQSMFSDLARGKRNWQLASFALLGLTLIMSTGLVTLATQSRITPYIVEVDRLGKAQAFGPAERLQLSDQRVITAQIAGFVRDIRTVLADPVAQTDLVHRAYAFVDQGAALFLGQYYAAPANDPRVLGKDLTRLVEVSSVLPIPAPSQQQTNTTWKVSWIETSIQRGAGGLPTEAAWEGYFTTRTVPPVSVDRITVNPLGLYVTSINWTQLASRSPRGTARDSIRSPAPTTSSAGVVPQ
jgi:type IV secretory pathway TrbF-like protein